MSRSILSSLLSVLIVAVCLVTPAFALAQSGDEAADKVFIGYLFGPPRDVNYKLYTHLCHAFVVADENGKIEPKYDVPSHDVVRDAHQAGVKVFISLGGWGWDKQFAAIVANREAEDRYIQAVMDMVDQYDYDGIDLDWEYPDTEQEVVGFERLVRRFRERLDALGNRKGRAMLQTMAVSSYSGTLKWLRTEVLLKNFDWINVMTYDFTGDWTDYAGHNSPLFASSRQPAGNPLSTELSMKYLLEERAMPADRLAVGIPLYGRGSVAAEPYARKGEGTSGTRVPRGSYSNLHRLLNEEQWVRQWDDEIKAPWLLSPDRTIVVGYDDVDSVTIKTSWAMKMGFRGVFFWQVASDRLPDGTNPLQEASRKALDAPR